MSTERNNREIILENIKDSKILIRDALKKDKIIIFFTRILEDLRTYSSPNFYGRLKELHVLIDPYDDISNPKIIYQKIKKSSLKSDYGLCLDGEEIGFIRTFLSFLDDQCKIKTTEKRKALDEIKTIQEKIIKKYLKNSCDLLEPYILGKLIASVGGLEKIARMPSSTIQLIGAEKALFRHLVKKARGPKHGMIYNSPKVRLNKNPGKAARQMANQLALNLRIDYFRYFSKPNQNNQKECPMMKHLTTAAEGISTSNLDVNIIVPDAKKSKWLAAIKKGLKIIPKGEENILYLGASTGTTAGYTASLTKGIVFAVENSAEMTIPLINLAEKRNNIAPIFCDARNMDYIKKAMFGKEIDILFQDIPSTDQVEILVNASKLVKKDAQILFSLKTQSLSHERPEKTFSVVRQKLTKNFSIISEITLLPFHRKHYFFVLKKK